MSPYIGLQLKPQMSRIWKLDFRHESRQGASSSLLQDTLANVPGLDTLGNPWIGWAGPLLRLRFGNS
mgnify:CR=1 FL=1